MRKQLGTISRSEVIRSEVARRAIVWAAQIGMFALSGVAAFLLRFDFTLPYGFRLYLFFALPFWILVKITVFHAAKLDRGWWRYISMPDLIRVGFANLTGVRLYATL